MKKVSKLFAAVLVFLLAGCLTSPADARLTAGPVPYSYAASGSCGKSLTYTIEDQVLKIKGTGDMYDYNYMEPPWDLFAFTEIEIESGVTSIGDSAFSYGSENGSPLTNVKLPDTLKRIGRYAFDSCNNIVEVKLPKSLTIIDKGAFGGCVSLKNVVLPEGLITVEDRAFIACTALSEFKMPSSVINIGIDILKDSGVPEPHPQPTVNIPAAWAKAELEEAAALGLTAQNTYDGYGYRNYINRVHIAELAVNLAEKAAGSSIVPATEKIFQDTTGDERDVIVQKAAAAGIVNGKVKDRFVPWANASREEIAVMLCRAADYIKEHSEGYAGLNMSADIPAQYTDAEQVSSWAVSSVAALADAGILTGTSPATLSPKANASVQEVILLTLRLYKQIIS